MAMQSSPDVQAVAASLEFRNQEADRRPLLLLVPGQVELEEAS
jgi:hypothetical protein